MLRQKFDASLAPQRLQDLARIIQLGREHQPPIDGALFLTGLEQKDIKPLDGKQHRPKDESVDEPEVAFYHGVHNGRLGSKCAGDKSIPMCLRSVRNEGRMPVALKLP